MSKPLELTVRPPIPECPAASDLGYAYEDWFDDRRHERVLVAKKRLTDAELAAEHWCCCALWFAAVRDDDDYEGAPDTRELQRRAEILERFATLPHYEVYQ